MKDTSYGQFAGIRNTAPPERLAPGDLVEADNIDIDGGGRAMRRAGRQLVLPGTIHSLWAEADVCLYLAGEAMYRLHPDFSTELLALGLSGAPMAYLALDGRVYHSDGAATGVFDGAGVRSWGIAIDPIVTAASATAGSLPAGVYQYAMTWRRSDGQESGTGLAGSISLPEHAGIRFSWAVPADPDLTEALLYLSAPDGATLYRAVVADIEAATSTYTGGPRVLPLATQWYDAPPPGQCLAHYRGRIYIGAGAFLYATTALGYEWCDLRDFLAIDGATITMLAPLEAGLLVGTGAGLHFMAGNTLAELAASRRGSDAVLARSLVMADGQSVTGKSELAGRTVALFATAAGICMADPAGNVVNLTEERYAFDAVGNASAGLRRDDTLTQYLLFLQT